MVTEHEAAMPLIPPMQRPEVTATVEPDDENQNYHICDQHECNQCPAGYYVSRSCTCPDTDVTCQPCQNGTFSKYSNSLNRCFFCQVCRPLDQVEIKKCTATTNTECACKNGTFCDPNYACETCQTCRKSCPPGQKKVQDCTPTSDMQCHPAPTSSTPTGSPGSEHLLWVLLSLSGLIVLAMALFCWQYSRLKNAYINVWRPKITQLFQYLLRNPSQEQREERDNVLNAQRDQGPNQLSPNGVPLITGACEPMHLATASLLREEDPESAEERNLVPANGRNSEEALRQSFYTFIKEVPFGEWKRFMRALGLTENEIFSAEKSERNVKEQYYQMLRTWLDKNGRTASVNVLLETLCAMDLKGVMEQVKSALISEGLYVYEERVLS
ncbi:tumor necrosis factor receptor superfamily member 10A isoform X2 [Python bivittatus]|uniref:Tumor necrosis factor receptor superfamily member 10A isoform X2 n=1 Tax=Python bivittatus TaxID=176946 RepID=A0A9F5MY43_PYTBI|nr:tumor necrosis factor receptor superfamily member 10A isoform X2 [Python bivittatus]